MAILSPKAAGQGRGRGIQHRTTAVEQAHASSSRSRSSSSSSSSSSGSGSGSGSKGGWTAAGGSGRPHLLLDPFQTVEKTPQIFVVRFHRNVISLQGATW